MAPEGVFASLKVGTRGGAERDRGGVERFFRMAEVIFGGG